MRGIKTVTGSRQRGELLAWCYNVQVRNAQQSSRATVRLKINSRQGSLTKNAVTMVCRAFMKYERRAQACEEQKSYDRALSMYEQLLAYAHEKNLGIAEKDRCVGAIMRCVAASSSALLF